MKIANDLNEAKRIFAEAEQCLHRSINIMMSVIGQDSFKRASDYFQMCLSEYTDAARVWGAVDGVLATKEIAETELETYEPAPEIGEMN